MSTYRLNTRAVAVAFAFSAPSIVNAEEAPVQAAKNIEQISVLGSRVSNRTSTESSSPIDLIDADDLTKGGFTELGQSLQATAPSFNFSRTQVSDGSDLFRPATLRGLQPDQTLVLTYLLITQPVLQRVLYNTAAQVKVTATLFQQV